MFQKHCILLRKQPARFHRNVLPEAERRVEEPTAAAEVAALAASPAPNIPPVSTAIHKAVLGRGD